MTVKRLFLFLLVTILMITTLSLTNYTIISKDPYYDNPDNDWVSLTTGNGCLYGISGEYLYCIDNKTGHLKWHVKTNHRIEISPFIFEDKLIIGPDGTNFYGLDAYTGRKIWGLDVTRYFGKIKSGYLGMTVSTKGYVYIIHKNNRFSKTKLLCLNASSSDKVWQKEYTGKIGLLVLSDKSYFKNYVDLNTHMIFGRWDNFRSYIVEPTNNWCSSYFGWSSDDAGRIICIEDSNGKIKWQSNINNICYQSLSFSQGMIYCVTLSNTDSKLQSMLHCLNFNTGILSWEMSTRDYGLQLNMNNIYVESLTIEHSENSTLLSTISTRLQCLNQHTGSTIWEHNNVFGFSTNKNDSAIILLIYGLLFPDDPDQYIQYLEATSGKLIWENKLKDYICQEKVGQRITQNDSDLSASMSNRIFILYKPYTYNQYSPDKHDNDVLLCIDEITGNKIWSLSMAGEERSKLIISKNNIYAISDYENLSCLDANTGVKLWEFKP